MTRVAAIDCGTNSIRLLVADLDQDGTDLTEVVRELEIVRLGHGVDRTGMIAEAAMARTLAVAARYAASSRELGVQRLRFVATSASRDAGNAADFVAGVEQVFDGVLPGQPVTPEVVSGDEEAALAFAGATSGLRRATMPGPHLVVDLGGGSTEFVLGEGRVAQAYSADVGSVRLTERYLHHDPPTATEVAQATADVHAALQAAAARVDLAAAGSLVGLAGTCTTVTAYALGLDRYDRAQVHLSRLPADVVAAACDRLVSMPRPQRLARAELIHPGRVDVIAAGALLWRTVIERVGRDAGLTEVITSEQDILDGIALSLA